MKRVALAVVVLAGICFAYGISAAEEMSKDEIIDIAVDAVQDKDIVLDDVSIIYDAENKSWSERVFAIEKLPADPNHGNLPHGMLTNKKYQAVWFDFKIDAPTKDVWVFVDTDTGDVITVYQEK